jgi:tetratricopeptide (TPR) repeat protein
LHEALGAGDPSEALRRAGGGDDALDTVVRIRLAYGRAAALRLLKRRGEAVAEWERAARAARAIGWTDLALQAYANAGEASYELQDWHGTVRLHGAALECAREAGRAPATAAALHNLGLTYGRLCEFADALRCGEEALVLKQALEPTPKLQASIAKSLTLLGRLHLRLGDYPEALRRFEQALELARRLGNDERAGVALHNLAYLRNELGDYRRRCAAARKPSP